MIKSSYQPDDAVCIFLMMQAWYQPDDVICIFLMMQSRSQPDDAVCTSLIVLSRYQPDWNHDSIMRKIQKIVSWGWYSDCIRMKIQTASSGWFHGSSIRLLSWQHHQVVIMTASWGRYRLYHQVDIKTVSTIVRKIQTPSSSWYDSIMRKIHTASSDWYHDSIIRLVSWLHHEEDTDCIIRMILRLYLLSWGRYDMTASWGRYIQQYQVDIMTAAWGRYR